MAKGKKAEPHGQEEPQGGLDLEYFRTLSIKQQVKFTRDFLGKPTFLIDPRRTEWYQQWGLWIFFATGVTAIVTPLEVVFFPPLNSPEIDFLFVLNRLMDIMFGIDLILNFFTMYEDHHRMIKDHSKILLKYLRTWFLLDFLALVPFNLLGLNGLRGARLLRCLRLLKLARMIRGNQAIQNWRNKTTVSNRTQDLLQTICATICLIHWMSCIFGMIGDVGHNTLADPEKLSWITYLVRDGKLKEEPYSEPMILYVYSLYWACVTVTSVGYGDIYPMNPKEVAVGCVLIILGAYFWAYVVGSFCNIVSNLDPHGIHFKQNMDAVNFMMKDQECSEDLVKRSRAYMNHTHHLQRLKEYEDLRKLFSPKLQKDIAIELCTKIIVVDNVPLFDKATQSFMVEVSSRFVPGLFSPCESVFRPSALFIILRGVALQGGVVLPSGNGCNLDFVLSCPELQDRRVWVSLGYVEMFSLEKAELDQVLCSCSLSDRLRVRRFTVRLAARRGFILAARREMDKRNWQKMEGNRPERPSVCGNYSSLKGKKGLQDRLSHQVVKNANSSSSNDLGGTEAEDIEVFDKPTSCSDLVRQISKVQERLDEHRVEMKIFRDRHLSTMKSIESSLNFLLSKQSAVDDDSNQALTKPIHKKQSAAAIQTEVCIPPKSMDADFEPGTGGCSNCVPRRSPMSLSFAPCSHGRTR